MAHVDSTSRGCLAYGEGDLFTIQGSMIPFTRTAAERLRADDPPAIARLLAERNFLRNPNDPRDKNTPDPPQPKDEFVLKFVKR